MWVCFQNWIIEYSEYNRIIKLKNLTWIVWHDVGHSFLWVWVWVSANQKIPLSVLARNPYKGFEREISLETGRRRGKVRSQGRTEESSQQKWTEEGSQQERAVNRSRGKPMVRERRLLGPVDSEAGLANMRGWVSVLGGFVGISHENTLAMAPRCTESYKKTVINFSLLALGTNPSPCLPVLFSSTLSIVYVVFCVFVKKCEIPLAGDERNH